MAIRARLEARKAAQMANNDSFINEVSEEVRRDRLYAFFRKWGWLIALGVIVILVMLILPMPPYMLDFFLAISIPSDNSLLRASTLLINLSLLLGE